MPSPPKAPGCYDDSSVWSAQDPKEWITGLACGSGLPVLEEGELPQIKIAGAAKPNLPVAEVLEAGRLTELSDTQPDASDVTPAAGSTHPLACFYFAQKGCCIKGYNCPHRHLTKDEILKMGLQMPGLRHESSYFQGLPFGTVAMIKKDLRKSKICLPYTKTGKCPMQDNCYFAHIVGPDAARLLGERNAAKECAFVKYAGECKNPGNCAFKHVRKAGTIACRKIDQRKQLDRKRKQTRKTIAEEASVDLLDFTAGGTPGPDAANEMDIFEGVPLLSSGSRDEEVSSTDEIFTSAEELNEEYMAELLEDKE